MTLHLAIGISCRLSVALAAGHFAALACIFVVPLPALARGLVGVALLVSLGASVWYHGLRCGRRAVAAIELAPDGALTAHCRGGSSWEGRVTPDSFVSPALIVLNVVSGRRRWPRTVVIATDAVEAEPFRQLRVWLRWGQAAGERAAVHDAAMRV